MIEREERRVNENQATLPRKESKVNMNNGILDTEKETDCQMNEKGQLKFIYIGVGKSVE